MFKILLKNAISDAIYPQLPGERYDINKEHAAPEGIIVRSANMLNEELPESLLAVARAGAGYNNIPVDECTKRGIVVFNTPGANANAVKELTLTALLLSVRNVITGSAWVQGLADKGAEVPALVEGGKSAFAGGEIRGRTLGVVGLGAIGAMVANDAHALGMEVLGCDPFLSVAGALGLSRGVKYIENRDQLLPQCDFITIHIPLTNKTKGMVDAEFISKMKPGAILLNFSRGELVDNDAVLKAVESGQLAAYGTDFPTAELLGNDKILCIPHLGASTFESEENCAVMAAKELCDYLEHGIIHNSVNLPDCDMPPSGKPRLAIIHGNTTGMVGRISAVLADEGINIADMINKSRGDIAYTMIDADSGDLSAAARHIAGIEGVSRVRIVE